MAKKRNAPPMPQITFGKFQNVDMRVARVRSAKLGEGTSFPTRVFELDLGHLGMRTAVGQYALIAEEELVGRNVVACINLGKRQIGPYESEALVMGAPHRGSPADQDQATPLYVGENSTPGDQIY